MRTSQITHPYYSSTSPKIKTKSEPLLQGQYGFHEHACNHNHKTADCWTNLATIGEGFSSVASNLYWGTSMADLISSFFNYEETPSALYWGLGLGMTGFSLGSMYAHRKLNIYHQHAHGHEPLDVQEECEHHVVEIHHHHNSSERPKTLSLGQKVALYADFISHTGDVYAPISASVKAMTENIIKTNLPPWGNALVQVGATLAGASTAVGNVRSCKHAIMAQNN